MRRCLALAAASFALTLAASTASPQTVWTRITPYTDIVWPQNPALGPRVQLGSGEWFEWTSVDTVPLARIIEFAKTTYGCSSCGR